MALRLPDQYPEVLALIAQTVDAELVGDGIDSDLAAAVAFRSAEAVRQAVGGAQIYISQGQRWIASERNVRIVDALSKLAFSDSGRYAKVAVEFKLSERWVRIIEQTWLDEERSRRQNQLFGESS